MQKSWYNYGITLHAIKAFGLITGAEPSQFHSDGCNTPIAAPTERDKPGDRLGGRGSGESWKVTVNERVLLFQEAQCFIFLRMVIHLWLVFSKIKLFSE